MNTLSYDVVIIGGGPAGMAAALASRKQGAKTLIWSVTCVLAASSINAFTKALDFIISAKR